MAPAFAAASPSGERRKDKASADMNGTNGNCTTNWAARALDLADLCAVSGPCEEARRLDEAMALFSPAQRPAGFPPDCEPDRARVAALAAAGGTLDATLALIGPRAGFLLSRGPGGSAMATVILPGQTREETAQGATPAMALLGAQLAAVLELLDAGAAAPLPSGGAGSARLN